MSRKSFGFGHLVALAVLIPTLPWGESPPASRAPVQAVASTAIAAAPATVMPQPAAPEPSTQEAHWTWPEKAENLQVLPKEWPGARLMAPMTGFTRALGVRCSYCHVGEEEAPLNTYDFASDANPNKDRAREMLRMLGTVGDHLRKLEPSGSLPVNMWCHTCHRGRPRPMTLDEELLETYSSDGGAAAVDHYAQLRTEYFGRGAYDFGDEASLNSLGYQLLGNGETEAAIKAFLLNTEHFPDSGNVWDSLAEGHLKKGDKELAKKYYEKSLALEPQNQNARDILKSLGR